MARAPSRCDHASDAGHSAILEPAFLIRVYAWIGILKPEGSAQVSLLLAWGD